MSRVEKPVVVVGSINADFVVSTQRIPSVGQTVIGDDFQVHFGGKGANQAVAVARLGYPVEIIGMVGSDTFGAQLKRGLSDAGVGVKAVGIAAGASGVAAITVSRSGENTIVVAPGANTHMSPDYLDKHREQISGAGIVLAQLEIPIDTVAYLADICIQSEVPFMLDPAPATVIPSEIWPAISWFTPNETEAAFYASQVNQSLAHVGPHELAPAFVRKGARGVVLKLGSRGVYLLSGGQPHRIEAPAVPAIDTTAAGDAFNGAFATGLMLGMNPPEAARFACAAAAISVTRRGAQPSMPTRQEVEEVLVAKG